MDRHQKLLQHILTRKADANVPFSGLCGMLLALGFEERIRGDHHIFIRQGVEEIVNLQPKGNKAKSYQVRQVRDIIIRHGFSMGE